MLPQAFNSFGLLRIRLRNFMVLELARSLRLPLAWKRH
jgi:hypothetical protein